MIRRRLRTMLRDDRGALSVELVILAPALVLIILLLIACGRIAIAGTASQTAAMVAAREASLSRTSAQAQPDATQAAETSMSQAGYNCISLTVKIDDSGLNAPLGTVGTVGATITCVVNLSDVAIPGLPGTKTITATATSPVDAFRERT